MELLGSGALGELPGRVFGIADRLAKGEADAPGEFAAIAREIASLERWADEVVPLRPLITLTRQTQSAIRSLVQVYDVIAAALVEERLDRAQNATEAVQLALDTAAEAAGEANAILGRANRVLNATDPTGAWVVEAFEGGAIAAIATGQALLAAHTGESGGPGSHLAAVFYNAAVATTGDPHEFWRLVSEHLQLFNGVTTEIVAMTSDPIFSSRAFDVTHDLWDAARRAAVAPEAATLRAEASELLETGHLLVEQPLKFHLGVACAITTRMTFADTQACDVLQLINIANDKGWEIRSGIGDAYLRNAFAHRDFELTGDEVSLSPQRRRRNGDPEVLLSLGHIQDGVLRLVETLAAMDLALLIAMDTRGLSISTSPLARVLVGPLLAGLGWSEVDVVEDNELVTISAVTQEVVPFAAIAFAAQPFIGGPTRLSLHLTRSDTGAQAVIGVDLGAYSEWTSATDELEKEAAFLRLGRATLVGDRPRFSAAQIEKVLALRTCELLVDRATPDPEVARQVRIWRGVARDLGLDDVNQQLGKGLRLRLQAGAGIAFDPEEFNELLAFAAMDVPELPASIL